MHDYQLTVNCEYIMIELLCKQLVYLGILHNLKPKTQLQSYSAGLEKIMILFKKINKNQI